MERWVGLGLECCLGHTQCKSVVNNDAKIALRWALRGAPVVKAIQAGSQSHGRTVHALCMQCLEII